MCALFQHTCPSPAETDDYAEIVDEDEAYTMPSSEYARAAPARPATGTHGQALGAHPCGPVFGTHGVLNTHSFQPSELCILWAPDSRICQSV